jgi:hypothetical protein
MLGTLDNPPITLQQDPVKIALLLVFCVFAAMLAGLLLWTGNARSVYWGYVLLLMFGVGAFMLAWSLVRPGTITLGRSGLTYSTPFRFFQYEWGDFDKFIVWSPRWPNKYPAFVYSRSSNRDRLGRTLTGGIGSFGGCWELPVSEMVQLLNNAHARWGRHNS